MSAQPLPGALLRVDAIDTYYGDSHILKGLSFEVRRGETVALLGRNGVGKTTALKSIVGWVPPRRGTITFDGHDIAGRRMMDTARLGIALVPEERRIFTNLTVAENLKLAQVTTRRTGWSLGQVYERFPRLRERAKNRGDEISGGEKRAPSSKMRRCSCWTSPPKDSRRSSCARSKPSCATSASKARRSCWSSRTSTRRYRSRSAAT